jgi:hypothetical protein
VRITDAVATIRALRSEVERKALAQIAGPNEAPEDWTITKVVFERGDW